MKLATKNLLACTAAAALIGSSAHAAIVVTNDHRVSGNAITGTLLAIDTPDGEIANDTEISSGTTFTSTASNGFSIAADGSDPYRFRLQSNKANIWEPDGSPTTNSNRWFAGAVASFTFDIPDGSVINHVYVNWTHQGNNIDGATYSYTEGASSGSVDRDHTAGFPTPADLVLSWTDSGSTVRNTNFESIFSGITVGGGDGFTLNIQDLEIQDGSPAPFIDAVIIDYTVPEPGSLALLGLGGLMIARRRRG